MAIGVIPTRLATSRKERPSSPARSNRFRAAFRIFRLVSMYTLYTDTPRGASLRRLPLRRAQFRPERLQLLVQAQLDAALSRATGLGLVPGELRLFHDSELEQSKTWLTE